ncbi:amidohydrolase family protein [Spirillospora sp. NPDC029432]|uniref:amidohydrolase family protein n=1 Tax=Spirillospora sp. NPDC029432 TaxID=3154599 RepID=UPI003456A8BF
MRISRRTALRAGVLATAGAAAGAAGPAAAHGPARIDTHHHALPPAMRKWAVEHGLLPPQGGPRWGRWDLRETLDAMDANRIELGVASAPAPSFVFKDRALAASGARTFNESLAGLVRDHPRRFGFFAYLPLLHIDVALEEAAYALDELGADGVLMMNTAGGRYLGDRAFDPLFAELDRRRAVVLTHPDALPEDPEPLPGIENSVADFMLDTTRCALNLIRSGTLDRHPGVSIILSHGGGFLPYIGGRVERAGRMGEGPPPDAFRRALRRFHYDTALPLSPYASPTLLKAAGAGRVLYGTDWPQVNASEVAIARRAFDRDPDLTPRARAAINRHNALRLLPTVAARLTR